MCRKPDNAPEPNPEERDARTVVCMQLASRIRSDDLEEFFSSVGKVLVSCYHHVCSYFRQPVFALTLQSVCPFLPYFVLSVSSSFFSPLLSTLLFFHFFPFFLSFFVAFSFLTLLIGRQEGQPACKKTEWWGAAGVVICLERGADLHMAQLMPLPLTICSVTFRLVLSFWSRLTWVVTEKGPLSVPMRVCCSFIFPCSLSYTISSRLSSCSSFLSRFYGRSGVSVALQQLDDA